MHTDIFAERPKAIASVGGRRSSTRAPTTGFGYGGEDGALEGALAGEEAMADGHLISDEEAWRVADTIPNGSAGAIILIEHLWAIPLRDADRLRWGLALADRWIHASDLIEVGLGVADA